MAAKEIPISKPSRIIKQQAEATIQHLIDAVVELVTNCDDSYKRLEDNGKRLSGKIDLYVSREKGGRCKEFKIKDCAQGMDRKKLETAIEYGGETSGFVEGKSVRGLLGRGLKESILALGEGEIYTKKEGLINCVKIWWDEEERKALYDFIENKDFEKQDQDISEFINSNENGTLIKIVVKNEKIKIPEGDKFAIQITDHYALRDINSSENRKIILTFEDLGRRKLKSSVPIKFTPPDGELIANETLSLSGYGDSIQIKIWESSNSLTSQPARYDPFSRAGVLVKTEDAILDNQLFKYDGDAAAFYFWGEVYCNGIAPKLREAAKQGKESEIIDLTRKGLNWRSDYCRSIQKMIEKQLTPLIQKKKKELEKGEKKEVSRTTKNVLKNICKLLDKLAKKEFKEWEGPVSKEFQELTLVPAYANIEVNKARPLSVYAPKELIKSSGAKISVTSDNGDIRILFPCTKRLGLSWNINLDRHPTNPNVWYKFFKVIGREIGKEAFISCKLGNQRAEAVVKVVQPIEEKEPKKKRKRKKGGFISDIVPNTISNPIQRVEYEENSGEMKIYVKFPGVQRYFASDLKEIESREDSRAILAELVGEAFCKVLARKKIETSGTFGGQEGQIDAFNSEVNNMQRKYLDRIHELILNWRGFK